MNPLGFKSAIYQLAKTGDAAAPPMFDVADSMLKLATSKMAMGQRTNVAERLVTDVAAARTTFSSVIEDGATGARSASDMATGFGRLATQLDGVGAGMSSAAAGHVSSARNAARQVSTALQNEGIAANGAISERSHMGIWQLRNDLDEAWNALGLAKVTGTLPR